ncbi:hypothetical protein ABBQ38_010289 [Trebouxia sp. C0009 RCD-2024]
MAHDHSRKPELQQLRDQIESQLSSTDPAVKAWCNETTLTRYLVAKDWNVQKAAAMLRSTLKWRQQFQPHKITWADVAHNASTGRVELLNSTDDLGRPVVLMRLRNEMAPSDHEHQLKFLVYTLERACELADDAGHGKMSWLLEMEGYSPKNSPPFAVTKQSISVLQNHYPERLGYAVMAKPPRIFTVAWNALYPFLDTETREKITFVKCDVVNSLKGVLGVDCIDVSMGGSRPGEFDLERYRERMIKLQSMHMQGS